MSIACFAAIFFQEGCTSSLLRTPYRDRSEFGTSQVLSRHVRNGAGSRCCEKRGKS